MENTTSGKYPGSSLAPMPEAGHPVVRYSVASSSASCGPPDALPPMRGTPSRPHRGVCLSPTRPSRLFPSSIAPQSSLRSTTSPPPPSRSVGPNLVPVKRGLPPSTDSANSSVPSANNIVNKPTASIRPAHSINDYNRHDFSHSAVPGSVYSLHVRY